MNRHKAQEVVDLHRSLDALRNTIAECEKADQVTVVLSYRDRGCDRTNIKHELFMNGFGDVVKRVIVTDLRLRARALEQKLEKM